MSGTAPPNSTPHPLSSHPGYEDKEGICLCPFPPDIDPPRAARMVWINDQGTYEVWSEAELRALVREEIDKHLHRYTDGKFWMDTSEPVYRAPVSEEEDGCAICGIAWDSHGNEEHEFTDQTPCECGRCTAPFSEESTEGGSK